MSTQKIDTPVYVDMQVKSDLSTGVQLRYGNEAFIVIVRSQNVHKTTYFVMSIIPLAVKLVKFNIKGKNHIKQFNIFA